MSKDYKVIRAVVDFRDLSEAIAHYSARGWDVHTFTVLPLSEGGFVMYVLLEKAGLPGHAHIGDGDEG